MLDELLGRAELKARIEELEEEKRHLERRAAAEEDRRSEAARKRQEAEAEVNRLEDKIEGLEERVERLSGTDDVDVDFRGTESLWGGRRDEILDRLSSFETDAEGALTAMVHDGVPESVSDALGDRAALVHRAAPCLVCVDDAGLVAVALDPPTPPAAFDEWGSDFRIERSWFAPSRPVWVALVRSDLFALGVYDGESVALVDEVEWTPSIDGVEFALTCAECSNTVDSEGETTRIDGEVYHFCCSSCLSRFRDRYQRLEEGV